jgi:hypothetical protein
MPTPADPELYEKVKRKIMKSYKKNSAFASGAIVKEYKQRGGRYIEDGKERNLERWFQENWIDVNPLLGITDDDAYPLFRPTVKVNENTPKLVQDIPVKVLKKQYKLKQKIKGEENLPDFDKVKVGGMIVRTNPFGFLS